MSKHKVVGDLSKPLALFLTILAAQGLYFVVPSIPLMFSRLDVMILNPLCQEIYPVQVTLDGRPLKNLEEANFNVSVDGQAVHFKLIRDRAIDAMVLLDASGSMAAPTKIEAGKGMTRFIADRVIASGGKIALITFNDAIQLGSDWTSNADFLNQALDGIQGSGSTRLWDAITEASPYLQAMRSSKPCELTVLVAISDFQDTASLTSQKDALTALEGTRVYGMAILYGAYGDVDFASADSIAQATRGRSLRSNEAKEAIQQLQTFFDSLYFLQIEQKGHITITVSYKETTGSDEIDS